MSRLPSRVMRRGSKYQFRRRVPDDVRRLGGFGGKEIVNVSLKTSDPIVARKLAADMEEEFERECARVRGVPVKAGPPVSVSGMVLTDQFLMQLRNRYVAQSLKVDAQDRLNASGSPELNEWLELRDGWDAPAVALGPDGQPLASSPTVKSWHEIRRIDARRSVAADVAFYARQMGVAPGSDDFARIQATLEDAEIAVRDQRRLIPPGSTYAPGYRPDDAEGPQIKLSSSWTLSKVAEDYLDHTDAGASWAHKVKVAVELFEEFLGRPTPVGSVTRDDIKGFVNELSQFPARAALRFPKMKMRQAIEANRARSKPFPLVSANTIRDNHYAVLRVLFGHALDKLGAIRVDPTERVKIGSTSKRAGKKSHFEIEELNALFRLPLFAGCASESRTTVPGALLLDDHQFWTPLLMLFTGARPSELAQLAVSDVKLEGEFPSISILTEFDRADSEERPYVLAFKTENARRAVPIHPTLIDIGFGNFVRRMQATGSERLFPSWRASSDPRKLYSAATWVRRFNEKCIPLITARKPRPTIYSLRHAFKTRLAVARVPPQFQNQVMGHAPIAMDGSYLGTLPVQEIYEEVAKVHYPGLDLSHLRR